MLETVSISTAALNFVITGQRRCGANILHTSINCHPDAVCHGDLLHPDFSVRRSAHEDYFGPTPEDVPGWCDPKIISPEQYLTTRVFDHAVRGEKAIGIRAMYQQLSDNTLWEYCSDRCREGDFTVIHVHRNPLACYVSIKQAEQTGQWSASVHDCLNLETPPSISIDMVELQEFCRQHEANEARMRALFDDRLELDYRELFINYRHVMEEVFKFLELPPHPGVSPGTRRLKNRSIRERIFNFDTAQKQAPYDVKPYFNAPDLF